MSHENSNASERMSLAELRLYIDQLNSKIMEYSEEVRKKVKVFFEGVQSADMLSGSFDRSSREFVEQRLTEKANQMTRPEALLYKLFQDLDKATMVKYKLELDQDLQDVE